MECSTDAVRRVEVSNMWSLKVESLVASLNEPILIIVRCSNLQFRYISVLTLLYFRIIYVHVENNHI